MPASQWQTVLADVGYDDIALSSMDKADIDQAGQALVLARAPVEVEEAAGQWLLALGVLMGLHKPRLNLWCWGWWPAINP